MYTRQSHDMPDERLDHELVEDSFGEREQRLVWQRERRMLELVGPQENAAATSDVRERWHRERRERHARAGVHACTQKHKSNTIAPQTSCDVKNWLLKTE